MRQSESHTYREMRARSINISFGQLSSKLSSALTRTRNSHTDISYSFLFYSVPFHETEVERRASKPNIYLQLYKPKNLSFNTSSNINKVMHYHDQEKKRKEKKEKRKLQQHT
ncbi:hypothetical protein BGAL_0314g00080 [Botrytis galanthina]|uniref:Uncharacterized protein n=1 Tax=Botrytis galanthina TaxID=278940 RepID=A0A4S8QQF7_9HELO|nr:hypothetical protein BGAL_0314g00080 [Botrytis galanthina]